MCINHKQNPLFHALSNTSSRFFKRNWQFSLVFAASGCQPRCLSDAAQFAELKKPSASFTRRPWDTTSRMGGRVRATVPMDQIEFHVKKQMGSARSSLLCVGSAGSPTSPPATTTSTKRHPARRWRWQRHGECSAT